MALIELQRFPRTPKQRYKVPNGTLFYGWLAANDSNLHRDFLIVRNGVKLDDDSELEFELSELDHIQIFDQPKGIVGDILSPIFKVVSQVFSFLAPKPAISNTGGESVDSPNNSLTGQTNTARVYKAKPDIYGQVRSFPDLIQESLFEYVRQSSSDGGLKYVTEWMCFGIGQYDYESVRYSESSLGSMAGAEYQVYQPGTVIPTINEVYGFDDVDGQEVPGPNESDSFPIETATANTVVSGSYAGGQIAVKIVKQAEFDYFMGLVLPHSVTFTINITYSTTSGNVTQDVDFSGTLISAVQTDDGAVTNSVRWYTFTMNNLVGPSDVPANATINTTKFILRDNVSVWGTKSTGTGIIFKSVQLGRYSNLMCSQFRNLAGRTVNAPQLGMHMAVGTRAGGGQGSPTNNNFISLYMEGMARGLSMSWGDGNQFIGGSCEANSEYGTNINSTCCFNTFIGMGNENLNAPTGDFVDRGRYTKLINCYSSQRFVAQGFNGLIDGGYFELIEVQSFAVGYEVKNAAVNNWNTGVGGFTDAGSGTRKRSIYDIDSSTFINTTDIRTPSTMSLTPLSGGTRGTWLNDTRLPCTVYVQGAASITAASVSRGSDSVNIPTLSVQAVRLEYGDVISLTWSSSGSAPSLSRRTHTEG